MEKRRKNNIKRQPIIEYKRMTEQQTDGKYEIIHAHNVEIINEKKNIETKTPFDVLQDHTKDKMSTKPKLSLLNE